MAKYVRRSAFASGGDFSNGDLRWYALGVQRMMSRPLADPTSWWFFAAIHGEYADPSTAWYPRPPAFPAWGFIRQPPAVSTTPLASQADRALYWNQCQHGSWYFLPWHRGYLMALEAQLRADIVAQGGPADWALPYWNYFGGNGGRDWPMPPAFSVPTLNGAPNPLFVAMRYGPDGNGNVYISTPAWAASHPGSTPPYGLVTEACMGNDLFTGSSPRTPLPGFGGPRTGFSHAGSLGGNMESNPHNLVHVYIGGSRSTTDYGLMADPGTAALDPIFYLHHGNIDRMWASWNAAGNSNPTSASWLNGPTRPFVMPWPGAAPWYYTPMQVANLGTLDYTYDDLAAAPVAPVGPSPLVARLEMLGATDAAERVRRGLGRTALAKEPELLGANDGPIAIEGAGARSIAVRLDASARGRVASSLALASAEALPDRVYLQLEGVRGTADASALGVYVGLADGASPEERRARLAGHVALFGMRRSSVEDGEHGGGGLTFALDITRFADEMAQAGAFDADALRVALLPDRPLPDGVKVTVGRVRAYREGQ